jgi:hypothetical protein
MAAGTQAASGLVIAGTSVAVWAIQTYLFHGAMPAYVSASLGGVISGVVGSIVAHVNLYKIPPDLQADFGRWLDEKRKAQASSKKLAKPGSASGGVA